MYSSKSNPMGPAKSVPVASIGPNSNPDARKAQGLLKKAYAQNDSLRGKSGM